MRHPACLLACLALCGSPAFATDPPCLVTVSAPWVDPHWSPVRFTISCPVAHRTAVTVELLGGTTHTQVELAPGVPVTRTVLVPTGTTLGHNYATISWNDPDGTRQRQTATIKSTSLSPCAIVTDGRSIDEQNLQRLSVHLMGSASVMTDRWARMRCSASVLSPGDLPDLWQGYRSNLVVWFAPGVETRLETGQRQALQCWAASGGILVFSEAAEARAWTNGACRPLTADLAMLSKLDGKAEDEHRAQVQKDNPTLRLHQVELEVQRLAKVDLDREVAATGQLLQELIAARRAHDARVGIDHYLTRHRLPGTEGSGGWLYALIALLFTTVAGPGLLWWVRKRKSPLLLLVVIPLCSLATCVLLLTWDLARLGIRLQRGSVELTVIDPQRAEHLAMIGQTVFGALTVNSLTLQPDERWSLGQLQADFDDYHDYRPWRYRHRMQERRLTLDWGRQHLQGQLVQARTTSHLGCTLIRPDRRRLAVRRDGQGYRLVNGLGVTVLDLVWCDAQNTPWRLAGPVADGQEAQLQPGDALAAEVPLELLPHGASHWWQRCLGQPETWRAHLATPLAAPPGLPAREVVPPQAWACGMATVESTP